MRVRSLLILGTMVLGVMLLGGVALAVTKTCTTKPCVGTNGKDFLRGNCLHHQLRRQGDETT
jgi:hypothetical protein